MTRTIKILTLLAVMIITAGQPVWAVVDPCNDQMPTAAGSAHQVSGNKTGDISGTPWGFEQWSGGGSNSMTYYDNGTFEANWSNNQDYLTRVGFRYGDNGPGVDHNTKHYAVDYRYTKTGSAQYGYIGVYGWTVNPQVEYYIVDDWYSKPNEQYIGEKFGEIEVDGAKYTIHAFLRQQETSPWGTMTFLQIFSVRQTPRQCGHIDISAHFKKWDELFTGQTKQLRGSKGGGSTQLKFGKVTEVTLMTEAGGNATGSVEYTYFNMTDEALTAYAKLSDDYKTLTFSYGDHEVSGDSEWNVDDTGTTGRGWSSHASDITKVVFDPSFANASPLSCSAWFEGCTNLATIEGLEYLDTRKTINLERMFNGCSSLKTLTIGENFAVGSKTTADNMFQNCSALANGRLIVSGTEAPSIAKDIFGVFANGTLITNMTKEQLSVTETSSSYTWKGGTFKSVGGVSVEYLDENGNTQTAPNALPVIASSTELPTGWYYVEYDVNLNKELNFTGDAHLILTDGTAMTASIDINQNDLTIYGQAAGTGTLTVNGQLMGRNVTINGGQVAVTGNDGISAETITLGWTNATDFIMASSYSGKVQTAEGKRFVAYDGDNASSIVSGSSEDANATFTLDNLANMTLKPLDGLFISAPGGIRVSLPGSNQAATADFSIASTPYYIYKGEGGTVGLDKTDADQMADGESVAWSLTGATLDTYNYIGTNGALQNTDNHLASFTLGNQDVTVAVDFNPFTMPGGYCGKSTVNDGKNVTWNLTENGTDSNDKVTYKLSIAKNATEGQTDYDMENYTSADAPWKGQTYNLILVDDETAYAACAPSLNATDKLKLAPYNFTIAKNASGWGTYCHRYPVSYYLYEASAYTISGLNDAKTAVTLSDALNTVAPCTPLLLNYGSEYDEYYNKIYLTAQPATATTVSGDAIVSKSGTDVITYGNAGNTLLAATDASFINPDGYKSYVLRSGQFVRVDDNQGLAAHRCVLNVSSNTGNAPQMLTIGETTGISDIKHETLNIKSDDAWYTLDGRRLNGAPTQKGIYVNKGVKRVMK
jgi:hypothetical protein